MKENTNSFLNGLNMNFPTMENFKFGKVEMEGFGLSIDGALSYKGKVFDKETCSVVITPSFEKVPFIYTLPTTSLKPGDVILRNDRPYLILKFQFNGVSEKGYEAVDLEYDKIETVLPEKYMNSFQLYTKVFSPFSGLFGNTQDNGGNNMLPLLMMSQCLNNGNNEGGIFSGNNILPLLLLGQNNGDSNSISQLLMFSALSNSNIFGNVSDNSKETK